MDLVEYTPVSNSREGQQQNFIDAYLRIQPAHENEYYPKLKTWKKENGYMSLYEIIDFLIQANIVTRLGTMYYRDDSINANVFIAIRSPEVDIWIPGSNIKEERGRKVLHLAYKFPNHISNFGFQPKLFYPSPFYPFVNPKLPEPISAQPIKERPQELPSLPTQPSIITTNNTENEKSVVAPEEVKSDSRRSSYILKKKRSRERTVQEALDLIKKWREISMSGTQDGYGRIQLREAADILGVPKKSLDDYQLMLNHGQRLGFDFQKPENLQKKFGLLRQFIKQKRHVLKQKKKRNAKKNLKKEEETGDDVKV